MPEVNTDSILDTIKKMIGPSALYNVFDADLITHINSTFFILYQLGVTETPFVVKDNSDLWEDVYSDSDLEIIKTYVYLKAKMFFDPPSNSSLISMINEQIKELECRINEEVDPKE